MTNIEAILNILPQEIETQKALMIATQSNIDKEKLDCLTMAKFQLEEFIRLSNAH
jgi:hypothetical protein